MNGAHCRWSDAPASAGANGESGHLMAGQQRTTPPLPPPFARRAGCAGQVPNPSPRAGRGRDNLTPTPTPWADR